MQRHCGILERRKKGSLQKQAESGLFAQTCDLIWDNANVGRYCCFKVRRCLLAGISAFFAKEVVTMKLH